MLRPGGGRVSQRHQLQRRQAQGRQVDGQREHAHGRVVNHVRAHLTQAADGIPDNVLRRQLPELIKHLPGNLVRRSGLRNTQQVEVFPAGRAWRWSGSGKCCADR